MSESTSISIFAVYGTRLRVTYLRYLNHLVVKGFSGVINYLETSGTTLRETSRTACID
jgi:hypothetical protein